LFSFFSAIKTSTTQTTKLVKVAEIPPDNEHILTVKSLNLTSSDVTETSQNDPNDTVEIVMTDESNVTEVSEVSERKSKGLVGYSDQLSVDAPSDTANPKFIETRRSFVIGSSL
jgi:hypothetical protein